LLISKNKIQHETYFAVFNKTSITKSMLGELIFANANARIIEHFNFYSLGGNFY